MKGPPGPTFYFVFGEERPSVYSGGFLVLKKYFFFFRIILVFSEIVLH